MVGNFLDAFGVETGDAAAIAGSGGKATLMYHLAREAVARGMTVLTTSTTHLHPPNRRQSKGLFVTDETPDWPVAIPEALQNRRHITVVGSRPRPDKLRGLDMERLTRLRDLCVPGLTLIKADGARTRPFKAPGPGEPMVPPWTTCGIVVVGLHSIGLPVEDRYVHRMERVCALSGLKPGQLLTEEAVARVVSAPTAYRRAFPSGSRLFLYLAWCNGADRHVQASRIAGAVAPGRYTRIFCGNITASQTSISALS